MTPKILLVLILIAAYPLTTYAVSSTPFVPRDFNVPAKFDTTDFRLRALTINDLVKDYDAVMSSADHIQKIWGPGWPDGLTLEQNLIDRGWHQKEFQRRRSFAYTVISLDESRILGCIYIDPTQKAGYDTEVYLWARSAALEKELVKTAKVWLKREWPFKNPVFPVTDLSKEEWEKVPLVN